MHRAKRSDRTHPKSLVEFIIESIEEVAPGRGREIYFQAFERFEAYSAARVIRERRCALERQLKGQPPPPEEEWTIDDREITAARAAMGDD
jgi:hypothetical protein